MEIRKKAAILDSSEQTKDKAASVEIDSKVGTYIKENNKGSAVTEKEKTEEELKNNIKNNLDAQKGTNFHNKIRRIY